MIDTAFDYAELHSRLYSPNQQIPYLISTHFIIYRSFPSGHRKKNTAPVIYVALFICRLNCHVAIFVVVCVVHRDRFVSVHHSPVSCVQSRSRQSAITLSSSRCPRSGWSIALGVATIPVTVFSRAVRVVFRVYHPRCATVQMVRLASVCNSMKCGYHYTWNREIVFNSQKLVKRRWAIPPVLHHSSICYRHSIS